MSPISPARRHLYPANWPEISNRVRRDADWRCMECDVPHLQLGYRYPKRGGEWRPVDDRASAAVNQCLEDLRGPAGRLTRIIITVHHVDGDPTNNATDNLRALCQRCHLRADLQLRLERKATGEQE